MERHKSGFNGSVNFSIELERGNSNLTEIGLKPRFIFRHGPSQWFALNSYSFVETDGASIVNEGFSHLRYNYSVSDVVILEALTQVQYNREQDLRNRFLLGSGLRFEVLQRSRVHLALGLTAMYEREELESYRIIETPRNSDYIALQLTANDKTTLTNTVYIQPAFDKIDDIRILDNLDLSVALSTWLAMTLSLEYRFDSKPPPDIKEYDLTLLNGLTVRF